MTKRGAEEAKLPEIRYADAFLIDGAPETSSQGSGTAEFNPTDNLCFAWFCSATEIAQGAKCCTRAQKSLQQ